MNCVDSHVRSPPFEMMINEIGDCAELQVRFPGCTLTRSAYTTIVEAQVMRALLLADSARCHDFKSEILGHVQLWNAAEKIPGANKWLAKEPSKSRLLRKTKVSLRRFKDGASLDSLNQHPLDDGPE